MRVSDDDDDLARLDRVLHVKRVGKEDLVELGCARLVLEAVVAHADAAVEAARETEVVVARLQQVLDGGGVGLLLVLVQEDGAESELLFFSVLYMYQVVLICC